MKGVHEEPISEIRRSAEIDAPRVLVAAATTAASSSIAQTLRGAGYVVSTTFVGADVLHHLRNRMAVELLVIDGCERSGVVGSIIDSVRSIDWALPIVLISRPDPELRAEAERLGVEAILESPGAAQDVLRAAMKIAPVAPELELDLAG